MSGLKARGSSFKNLPTFGSCRDISQTQTAFSRFGNRNPLNWGFPWGGTATRAHHYGLKGTGTGAGTQLLMYGTRVPLFLLITEPKRIKKIEPKKQWTQTCHASCKANVGRANHLMERGYIFMRNKAPGADLYYYFCFLWFLRYIIIVSR